VRPRLLGVLCAASAALTGLGAPAAKACNEPRLDQGSSLSPGSLGPNETGTVTVANTEQGAQYTLVGDGRVLASGVDETREPGFTAQFTMPDLGPEPRAVAVRLDVTHEGGSWPSEATLQYVPPAPPQPAPAEPNQPAAGQSPAPASPGAASPPVESSPEPKVPPQRGRHADGPAARDRPAKPRRALPVTQPVTNPPPTAAARPQPVATAAPSSVVPAASRSDAPRPVRTARHAVAPAPLVRTHRRMIDSPQPVLAPTVRSTARDHAARARRDIGLPLALVGGIGALALALLVLLRRRRRGGEAVPAPAAPAAPVSPTPAASQAAAPAALAGSLALEAELQELVAEQRARAILGHGDEHVSRAVEVPDDGPRELPST